MSSDILEVTEAPVHPAFTRLQDMARQRSQSPAETLAAALDALAPRAGGTPREHAREVVMKGNSCPDCAAGVCRFCVTRTNDVERAIRAAAAPLVAALREALDTGDGAWLGENGDDSWIRKRDGWQAALKEWEA